MAVRKDKRANTAHPNPILALTLLVMESGSFIPWAFLTSIFFIHSITCIPSGACHLLTGHCISTSLISHTTTACLLSKCKCDPGALQLTSLDCLPDTWIECRVQSQQNLHNQCSPCLAAPQISHSQSHIFALAPPFLVF